MGREWAKDRRKPSLRIGVPAWTVLSDGSCRMRRPFSSFSGATLHRSQLPPPFVFVQLLRGILGIVVLPPPRCCMQSEQSSVVMLWQRVPKKIAVNADLVPQLVFFDVEIGNVALVGTNTSQIA